MKDRVDLNELSMELRDEVNTLLRKVVEAFETKGEVLPTIIYIRISLTTADEVVDVNIKAIDAHLKH